MKCYVMTCVSGVDVLVRAASSDDAETQWDAEAAKWYAEDRVPGTTRPASREDVKACVESGHDYR